MPIRTKIIATGSYVPQLAITGEYFKKHEFYESSGQPSSKSTEEIVQKFEQVAGIVERRYAQEDVNTSEMAFRAASRALDKSGIDPETLDYIIIAHNWGDVSVQHNFYDTVPNVAARVKHKLGIRRSGCVAYDLLFGCPGWLQGLIQADYYLRSGDARRVLVIGSDTVSRVSDPHDRDSMLFSDGAGAVIVEGVESDVPTGILKHGSVSDCLEELSFLTMNYSFNPEKRKDGLYLKMKGPNVLRYALEKIPPLVSDCLAASGVQLGEVKKMLIHQANKKMIEQIARKLFNNSGQDTFPQSMLPINVNTMGNNSVATIPILLDSILNGEFPGHAIAGGDVVVFASVGAGMHANCVVYKF